MVPLFFSKNGCERAHYCTFAHDAKDFGKNYINRDKWTSDHKLVMCKFYGKNSQCWKGAECPFAHGFCEMGTRRDKSPKRNAATERPHARVRHRPASASTREIPKTDCPHWQAYRFGDEWWWTDKKGQWDEWWEPPRRKKAKTPSPERRRSKTPPQRRRRERSNTPRPSRAPTTEDSTWFGHELKNPPNWCGQRLPAAPPPKMRDLGIVFKCETGKEEPHDEPGLGSPHAKKDDGAQAVAGKTKTKSS